MKRLIIFGTISFALFISVFYYVGATTKKSIATVVEAESMPVMGGLLSVYNVSYSALESNYDGTLISFDQNLGVDDTVIVRYFKNDPSKILPNPFKEKPSD